MDFDSAGYDEDSKDEFANETLDMLFEFGWKGKIIVKDKQFRYGLGGRSLLAWGSVHAGDPPGGPPR